MGHNFSKISAYVSGEFTTYDSEEEEDGRDASAAPSDTEDPRPMSAPDGKSSLQASQSSQSGTPMPQTSEDFDGSESPAKSEIPTSHPADWSAESDAAPASGAFSPKDLGGDANALKVSDATSSAAPSRQPTPEIKPARPSKSGLKFKKLTPIAAFESYLANPADMSYDDLYHRSSVVAKVLAKLQAEYDLCEKKTSDFESAKKYAAKIAADAKKEEDERISAESDAELLRLHAQYREQLRMSFRDYNAWVNEQEAAADPEVVPAIHWEFMRNIKNPDIMGKVNKRRKANEKEAAKPVIVLEDTPLPALRRGDDDVRKKRVIFQDPVVFEDRKTADVYMADYSKHRDAIGFQTFKDRRAIATPEEVDENGRPKRTRGKRACDTEQTNTPGDSEDEEAPLGKRRRTARIVQDLPTSPARRTKAATREGSPQVATFKSGKRIGRPPKVKGEAATSVPKAASKSKLQQSHLPPTSEPGESDESEEELPGGETRELEEDQEAELQQAAEALVQQTKEQPVIVKRGTKIVLKILSDEEKQEMAAKSSAKKKAGRATAKPKAARGRGKKAMAENHIPAADEDEIIQSTEQDGASLLESPADSRPTSSSSYATGMTSSRASRAASRAATRERTARARTASINGATPERAKTSKGKDGKRKRAVVASSAAAPVQPAAPAPKRRKLLVKQEEDEETQKITAGPASVMNGKGSTASNGRPKRQRTVTTSDPTYLSALEDENELNQEEALPAQSKRRKGGKGRGTKKGKGVKHEASESEYISDADHDLREGNAGVQPKKRATRVGVKKTIIEQPEDEVGEIDGFAAYSHPNPAALVKGKGKAVSQDQSESRDDSSTFTTDVAAHLSSEIPSGAQTPVYTELSPAVPNERKKLAKKAAQQSAPSENGSTGVGSSHESDDEDGEMNEAERKRKRKSKKLSAATKLRWATGQMAAPMVKRAATNASKKAEKIAAQSAQGSHFDGTINGGIPASTFMPNPFFVQQIGPRAPAPVPVSVPPLPMSYQNNPYGQPPPQYAPAPAYAHQSPYHNPVVRMAGPSKYHKEPPSPYHSEPSMHHYPPHPQHGHYTSAVGLQAPAPLPIAMPPAPPEPPRPAKKRKPAGAKKPNSIERLQAEALPPPILPQSFYSPSEPTSAVPAPTRNSTRVRKPSRHALGLDGADDERDEDVDHHKDQFKSEYERFQALTSPRSPYTLGKRKRKSLMDLSAMNNDDDDEI